MHDSDLRDAFTRNPDGEILCFSALGRVVDAEKKPLQVLQQGDANGISVTVQILTGPFAGVEVQALCGFPLGYTDLRPIPPGTRVLVHFLEGHLDGLIVAAATVPGGKENPLPTATAGIKVDEEGLAANHVVQPPKKVGLRFYMRGGMLIVRLKGKQDDFASAFAIECDDGTFVRVVWDSSAGRYAIKMKESSGAFLAIDNGFVALGAPDGATKLEVSDGLIMLAADNIVMTGQKSVSIDGNAILLGMGVTPPSPTNGAAYGPGATGKPGSFKVFVGAGT